MIDCFKERQSALNPSQRGAAQRPRPPAATMLRSRAALLRSFASLPQPLCLANMNEHLKAVSAAMGSTEAPGLRQPQSTLPAPSPPSPCCSPVPLPTPLSQAQYAVRGEIVSRAMELELALKRGEKLRFKKLTVRKPWQCRLRARPTSVCASMRALSSPALLMPFSALPPCPLWLSLPLSLAGTVSPSAAPHCCWCGNPFSFAPVLQHRQPSGSAAEASDLFPPGHGPDQLARDAEPRELCQGLCPLPCRRH
jgi:hypothetical protein